MHSVAAGITLGAMAVRLGEGLSGALRFAAPAVEYKLAFVVAAAFVLLGLLDTLRLPRGAGDHFVARK